MAFKLNNENYFDDEESTHSGIIERSQQGTQVGA